MPDERKNVYKKYDVIGDWFLANRDQSLIEKKYLDRLVAGVGKGGKVLDLGCGTGLPVMAYLIQQGLQVSGVDASERMLELARQNLPEEEFIHADMRRLDLGRTFDAIIAWHSFFHLPASDQPEMFSIFKKHLNPGGQLLFTSGKERGEAWGMNGGENLYHASLDKQEYELLLKDHGFSILGYVEDDPECGLATVWMAQGEL